MFEYISLKFKKTLANRVRGIDSNPFFKVIFSWTCYNR